MRRVLVLAAIVLAGCSSTPPAPPTAPRTVTPPASSATTAATASPAPVTPQWTVGATPLPLRPDGFGQVLPTPPVLRNRALPTADRLPPPADGRYAATVAPVPPDVLARSTWRPSCPVASADLRYLTMSFWGFDGRAHTGEMIVGSRYAEAITRAFGHLYDARFPLEEMRVVSPAELNVPPTGDGNNTTAFVCRSATGQTRWSAHAYGLALDVNPFCNPYIRGDLVLPELASSYVDRGDVRPGMIEPGDVVVRSFTAIGWSWGAEWTTPKDIQHFSATGD
ncbi:M15 family metallopeptidase [Actinophytocola oryzae]|uniref:D-alanyl-D-alanine carboxypeptidase-like protein n=1 Tax=Actinophytocola oryzae TaxID=502181 RepID=A0A4R7UXB0_9PSEU|nr:M15 family metallopeptidase [Actinophytocola oryzae]TDV39706.1 D-alanyl-D-alanine carboxypeptidase-like protein [Actinophytocola oryzae]